VRFLLHTRTAVRVLQYCNKHCIEGMRIERNNNNK
jgi:hypothetical protein